MAFTDVIVNTLDSMSVIDGLWYVIVKGDYAGRVYGNVYDISNNTNPVAIQTTVSLFQGNLESSLSGE